VIPECRGLGIYRLLFAALVEKARELKRPTIWSATAANNHHMRDVAKKQGRVEVAVTFRFEVPPS
jgi:L-amino acid N-acyltransferase YncA